MPQVPIWRPFGELDMCDQLRLEPRTDSHIGSINRILAGGNAPKALAFTRGVNGAVRVVQRFSGSPYPPAPACLEES